MLQAEIELFSPGFVVVRSSKIKQHAVTNTAIGLMLVVVVAVVWRGGGGGGGGGRVRERRRR